MLSLNNLQVEHRVQPIGLDVVEPRVSWQLVAGANEKDLRQVAYALSVSADGEKVWESGRVESSQSVLVPLAGIELAASAEYEVEVTAWSNHGDEASATTTFETGLLNAPAAFAAATWIDDPFADADESFEFWRESPFQGGHALPVFTRTFTVADDVARARLYLTAHGIYEVSLDGKKVGDAWFAPGWTSYHKRLQYQTLPLELAPGEHALEVTVAPGWYKGALGFVPKSNNYGDTLGILGILRMWGSDGEAVDVVTDADWRVTTGSVQRAEFYYGEICDAGAASADLAAPKLADYGTANLVAQEDEPVRCVQALTAIDAFTTPEGDWVLDFGQNLTGVVEAALNLEQGRTVKLRHAESLDENGNFYTGNLSFATATDCFTSAGEACVYTPRFTFHGFRYLCVEGLTEAERDPAAFKALVLTTSMARTGTFLCSSTLVNQLQSNIQWGQQDNFLEVPTDCPQRSERLGWTGDIRAYASTALFNSDATAFLAKWLRDLAADQDELGGVPGVAPNILDAPGAPVSTASFWGDAATVVPWDTYLASGDARVLEEQYPSMKAWVDYMTSQAGENGLWQTGFQYGDWLGLDAEQTGLVNERIGATDVYFLANVNYADSARIVADAARVLGRAEDAEKYEALHQRVIDAWCREYLTASGRMVSETQTACVMALNFGMLPEEFRAAVAERLANSIAAHKNHNICGFMGTPFVCDVLSDTGHHDLAGKLLLQEENPGWLYEVKMGATTIWERWDSILPDHSFNPKNMNSLNHYAYGSVGSWMYRRLGGIEALEPGYARVRIAPQPIKGITWAQCSHESPYGLIRCEWRCENHVFSLEVEVPANTEAEVLMPGWSEARVLGSGVYRWEEATELVLELDRYSMETQLKVVIQSPVGKAALEAAYPGFTSNPMLEYVMDSTLNEVVASAADAKPMFEAALAAMNAAEK